MREKDIDIQIIVLLKNQIRMYSDFDRIHFNHPSFRKRQMTITTKANGKSHKQIEQKEKI